MVFADQLSKWLAVICLEGEPSFYFIQGLLRFSYVENRGAAFGMLENDRWVFLVLSTLTIVCLIAFMFVSKPQSKLERIGLAMILAGGIGNMIDRVILGYVIDFIDFYTIWNYVFNIADSFICIGVGLIILYVIMLSVEEYKTSRRSHKTVADNTADSSERTVCHAPGEENSEEKAEEKISENSDGQDPAETKK